MLTDDNLTHYKTVYNVDWVGNLPENCPPEDILVPNNEVFYRLLLNKDHFVDNDWKTYIELYPNKKYIGENFILAHGLSILHDGNFNKLKKLPQLKKFNGIAKIRLNPIEGVIKKSCSSTSHYTWWRTTAFNINSAEIINNEET